MAGTTGLEPATSDVTGRRSNQLSYVPANDFYLTTAPSPFTIKGVTDRRPNPVRQTLEEKGYYHSFRLPDGRVIDGVLSLDHLENRLNCFGIPQDLTGLRVLDIGPWDGYCTFELERRGAHVTGIDYVDLDSFRLLHAAYNSRAEYLHIDVYQLDPQIHGLFDIVLCFGVLYHLKHPLLALERICAVTRGVCHVDSFCIDPVKHAAGERPDHPYAEFYPYDELGGQLDNWCGPTVTQIEAWIRTAGFARAEYRGHTRSTALVSGHRRWDVPAPELPPVGVTAVSSHRHRGNNFSTMQEEYVCVWCHWADEPVSLAGIFPEVDGYGVAPLAFRTNDSALYVSFPLPPGLTPGEHRVTLRVGRHAPSAPLPIYVDLPPLDHAIELVSVQDALTFAVGAVVGESGDRWLTVWVRGLSVEAGCGNTAVLVGGTPHDPAAVTWRPNEDAWQINVHLRPSVQAGEHSVQVAHRQARSGVLPVSVKGAGTRV